MHRVPTTVTRRELLTIYPQLKHASLTADVSHFSLLMFTNAWTVHLKTVLHSLALLLMEHFKYAQIHFGDTKLIISDEGSNDIGHTFRRTLPVFTCHSAHVNHLIDYCENFGSKVCSKAVRTCGAEIK